jgi:hypothetical protein
VRNDECDSIGVGIEGEWIWKWLLREVIAALWQSEMTTVVLAVRYRSAKRRREIYLVRYFTGEAARAHFPLALSGRGLR